MNKNNTANIKRLQLFLQTWRVTKNTETSFQAINASTQQKNNGNND